MTADPSSKMIFICGCGHSGTSLLTSMFGAHPNIYSIPRETQLFVNSSLDDAQIRTTFRENWGAAAAAKGAEYMCEKTPTHIHHLDRIRRVFPGAAIIIPVRDPRDTALSIKLRGVTLTYGYQRWVGDNTVVMRELKAARSDTFIFRYEDFMDDVEGSLARMCGWLSLSYDPAMLRYYETEQPYGIVEVTPATEPAPTEHNKFRAWQVRQPLMERRGRWRTMLAHDEIEAVEKACQSLMPIFSYQPEVINRSS